jgi:hypothetical protein
MAVSRTARSTICLLPTALNTVGLLTPARWAICSSVVAQ